MCQSTIVGHIPPECYRRRRGKSAALLAALKKAIHPVLCHASLATIRGEECHAALLRLEEQMLVAAHKFGVIFAKENQITENELFSNSTADRPHQLVSFFLSSSLTSTCRPTQRKAMKHSKHSSSCSAPKSN